MCRTIVVSWAFEIYRKKIQHNNKKQERSELYERVLRPKSRIHTKMSNVIIKATIKECKTSKLTERKSGMVNKLNPKEEKKNRNTKQAGLKEIHLIQ